MDTTLLSALSPDLATAVFDGLDVGLVVHGPDGSIVRMNETAERILELSAEPVDGPAAVGDDGSVHARRGRRWRLVDTEGHPLPPSRLPARIVLRTGRELRGELVGVYNPIGLLTWMEVDAWPVRQGPDDELVGVISSFRDVTTLRFAESDLLAAEQRFRRLIDAVEEAVCAIDRRGLITHVNPVLCTRLQRPAAGLVGRALLDFVDASSLRDAIGATERHVMGDDEPVELWLRAADDSLVHVAMESKAMVDDHGSYAGGIAVLKVLSTEA